MRFAQLTIADSSMQIDAIERIVSRGVPIFRLLACCAGGSDFAGLCRDLP